MRVVMLTPDTIIDRRIILEADALMDSGHEVILLANSDQGIPVYERIGRVKIERCCPVAAEGKPPRVNRIQNSAIDLINRLSAKTQTGFRNQILATTGHMESLISAVPTSIWRKVFGKVLLTWNRLVALTLKFLLKAYTLCGHTVYALSKTTLYLLARHSKRLPSRETIIAERALFYDPDVVHVHDLPYLAAGVFVKRRLRIPLIYDAHEFYPEQPRVNEGDRRRLRRFERKHIYDADHIITVNPVLARIMEDRYPGIRIDVVQNAVPAMNNIGTPDRFRKELRLPRSSIILLYQGWLAPGRNLESLIRGMHRINKRFLLVLMGYGDYTDSLKQLAQEHTVGDRVLFVPSKGWDELPAYTASADIGLIPYPYGRDINTHNCSPNKLYEYISAELPILANRLPFVQEVVERHGFGYCADMQNDSAFATAVNAFPLQNLDAIKSNIRENKHLYDWNHESQRLLEIYGKCLDPRPPTGAVH